jgi:hypothetical protein
MEPRIVKFAATPPRFAPADPSVIVVMSIALATA